MLIFSTALKCFTKIRFPYRHTKLTDKNTEKHVNQTTAQYRVAFENTAQPIYAYIAEGEGLF
jgi:hypothetical protein